MGTRQLLEGTIFFDEPPAPGPGSAGTITPLIAHAEAADNQFEAGSSGIAANPVTEGDAEVTLIETAVTAVGVVYLVMYRGNGGIEEDAGPGQIQMRLLHGTTELGYSIDEKFTTIAGGTPRNWRGTTLAGYAIITGDGNTLSFVGKHIDIGTALTSNFGAAFIAAIPLTLLNEGHDYFQSVQQDDTTTTSPPDGQEGTILNPSGGLTTVPLTAEAADSVYTLPLTVPDTGDYLVLMSMELEPTNVHNSNGIYVYPVIDGSVLQQGHSLHGSSNGGHTDDPPRWNRQSFSYSEVVELTAGYHEIEIRALGLREWNRLSYIRRPRIIVLRGDSFTGLEQTKITAQTATWNTTASFITVMTHTTAAAGATEDVIVLGNAIGRCGDRGDGSNSSAGGVSYNFLNNTDNLNWNWNSGICQGIINPTAGALQYPQQQFMGHFSATVGQQKIWVIEHHQLQGGSWGGVKTGFATWERAATDWVAYLDPGDTPGMTDSERDTRIMSLHLRTTGT
jgi:hypothetical protein